MTSFKTRLAWVLVGLVAAGGCEVSTDDDIDFDQGGRGGTTTTANGGTGMAGSSLGGTAGLGGTGNGGTSGSGGSNMSDAGTAQTCEPNPLDDESCLRCVKSSCCDEWLACDDQDCLDEFTGIQDCLASIAFPESEDYYACSMENAVDVEGMILQPNTSALLLCIMEQVNDADSGIDSARCGEACFDLPVLE